jgi:hypothetical protein
VPKTTRKKFDMGKIVAVKTVRSIFGESSYNIYENDIIQWEEGEKIVQVNGYRLETTIKRVEE